MMKEYAGVYDISTSWNKLKTLPMDTFKRKSLVTSLSLHGNPEEYNILDDKTIPSSKRKSMVLKSWMCKKQQSFWKEILKEVDDLVVKKKQIKQQLDDYMKPYKNAKYIVMNLDDENKQLCFGILKVSKITKTKITGNIIVSKNYKYRPTNYSIVLLRQTDFIDSVTIGEEMTLYVKGCSDGVGKNTSWRMKNTDGDYGDINSMKCIEREDMSYYVTRERITLSNTWSNGELFVCNNIKRLNSEIGLTIIKPQHNEFNRIKMYYDKSYNRTNEDLDWMFENK